MQDKPLAPHPKTNSKFILVQYDKNLLQSNGHSRNPEIPMFWDFQPISIINCWVKFDVLRDSQKTLIFAADLAKGMPCKSATVPAAVSPCKACQSCHCTAHPYGKATGSGESEDLPNREFDCKPSGTRATLSAAISIAACDGLALFV